MQEYTLPEQDLCGHERIMFVDDEKVIIDIATTIFDRYGYRVEAFMNPREALENFSEKPEKFDLVITDMIMPHMSGLDFAEQIVGIRPDMPVLLSTGLSETLPEDKKRERLIVGVITKPYPLKELLGAVRNALGGKGGS